MGFDLDQPTAPVAAPQAPPAAEPVAPAYAAAPPVYAPPPAYAPPVYPAPQAQSPEVGHWSPGAPPPPSWGAQAAAPKRRYSFSMRGIGGLLALAVLALGAYRGYQRYFGTPYQAPERIGDAMLMRDETSQRDAASALREMRNFHRSSSGLYGAGGYASMLLLVGDADDRNARSLYDTFADEARDERMTISRPAEYDGVLCASLSDTPVPGIMCFWGSGKSDGFLLHINANDLDEAARLTHLAWDAVEA
ncbi:MAG TPA: hypothetical protein VGX28_08445 [Frankiaceae bacterium]|nr:hypothetical protein [Frankiaceae bacterium]